MAADARLPKIGQLDKARQTGFDKARQTCWTGHFQPGLRQPLKPRLTTHVKLSSRQPLKPHYKTHVKPQGKWTFARVKYC